MLGSIDLFENFMPHGMCYQWRPDILWLNVLSDFSIAIAYFSIPIALLYYLRKRKNVPFTGVFYMFCVFIFACGVTHIVSIFTVWNGLYGLQGVVKLFTAVASVLTAIMLYPVIPMLLALRSPQELELANASLKDEIEHRKTSEAQSIQLQSDLARLGRVTTVGQLANGLAHELNQPLLAIAACTETAVLVARKTANPPKLFDCLDDIQSETQRAGAIIRALRQLVTNKTSAWSSVDLNDLVDQAVRLMSGEARNADVQIEVVEGHLPLVSADSVQIAQVLVNLIRNSVEAISELHNTRKGKPATVRIETIYDGSSISVTVSDNGPGLPYGFDPFTPFETNKTDGMGVGLSISRDIMRAHGGDLKLLETAYVDGATFTFYLPMNRHAFKA